jgi:hypothetical protein
METQQSLRDERRKYYRINDVVQLRYERVPEDAGETEILGAAGSLEVSTATLLAEIDREINQTVNAIWTDHPAVAQALGLLNRKISVLAAQALEGGDSEAQSYDDRMVSLSGCGIAFEAASPIAPGTRLLLSVILRPSQITLSITGKVVGCDERDNSKEFPYWVRVDFDDNVHAQEQIIQHVVQKQGALLSDSSER